MSKRSTLCIMLVMLVIADIAVGKSMISAYGSSGNAVTKESDENGCNGVQKETSELQENETDKTYSVDVSDCNFVTIRTKSGCYAPTTLVTNGFKVVYK